MKEDWVGTNSFEVHQLDEVPPWNKRGPVYIRWIDSSVMHDQVDTRDLPKPNTIESVGWLAKDEKDYIVLSQEDHVLSEDSYQWRRTCAIPRFAVLEMKWLEFAEED